MYSCTGGVASDLQATDAVITSIAIGSRLDTVCDFSNVCREYTYERE